MDITPDKGLDKAFLKAGEEVPIRRPVLSRQGTVHFRHSYIANCVSIKTLSTLS